MKLNDKEIHIQPQSISSLLFSQGIEPKGIAVAVNNKVVKRIDWDEHILSDTDNVVVIAAAYGG